MKKLTSIILAAVMLAAMLSAFCVPAFAEETKTADDYLQEAEALISIKKYNEAADAYCKAGELYLECGDTASAADAYYQAGDMFRKAGDSDSAAEAYKKSIELYTEVIHACLETVKLKKEAGDSDAAAAAYSDAGKAYERIAKSYGNVGDSASKADAYMKAAACCIKANDWENAGISYGTAAAEYGTLYDFVSAGDTYMKAGACWMKAGKWDAACDEFSLAVGQYSKIDDPYYSELVKQQTEMGAENESDLENIDAEISYLLGDYYEAMAYVGKASAYRKAGKEYDADKAINTIYYLFSWGSFNGVDSNGYQGNEGEPFAPPFYQLPF